MNRPAPSGMLVGPHNDLKPFSNLDVAAENSIRVPVHEDRAITELRAVVAVWDKLHSTTGLPPMLESVQERVDRQRAHSASAASRTEAARRAAVDRASLTATRLRQMNIARVTAEREAIQSAREETRQTLAGKVKALAAPPSPSRPSTARSPSSSRSLANPPLPLRPPSAPTWPLPRTMLPSKELDGERDAYLTKWWCDGGGKGSSPLYALFPAVLSPRERGWQMCNAAQHALESGCVRSAMKQFSEAAEFAPDDVRLKWALKIVPRELEMATRAEAVVDHEMRYR